MITPETIAELRRLHAVARDALDALKQDTLEELHLLDALDVAKEELRAAIDIYLLPLLDEVAEYRQWRAGKIGVEEYYTLRETSRARIAAAEAERDRLRKTGQALVDRWLYVAQHPNEEPLHDYHRGYYQAEIDTFTQCADDLTTAIAATKGEGT